MWGTLGGCHVGYPGRVPCGDPLVMPGRVHDGLDGYTRPYRALQASLNQSWPHQSYLASLNHAWPCQSRPGHVNPGLVMSILDLVILDLRS